MARTADEIKEAVKDHYGERARTVASSCCGDASPQRERLYLGDEIASGAVFSSAFVLAAHDYAPLSYVPTLPAILPDVRLLFRVPRQEPEHRGPPSLGPGGHEHRAREQAARRCF